MLFLRRRMAGNIGPVWHALQAGSSPTMGKGRKKAMGFLKHAGHALGQSASPIAIDFGVGSLKVLQVDGGATPNLIAAACIDTPEDLLTNPVDRIEFQAEALGKLIRGMGFKGKRAACAIPASQTFCKPIQVQKADGVSVHSIVEATLANQFGCDPRSLVIRHFEVGLIEAETNGGAKTEVACMTVGRELVDRLMLAVRDARLEPVGMHSEFEAVVAALGRQSDPDETTLYIDIGCGATNITIAHGSNLAFARCVEMAGLHLDRAVAAQRKITLSAAHNERHALENLTGAGPVEEVEPYSDPDAPVHTVKAIKHSVDLSEQIEILADEVTLCIRYHDALFPSRRVSRVMFLGGEATHTALCKHIAQALRLQAQIADPMAGVARSGDEPCAGVDLSKPQPGWAVPLGVCLGKTDL